MSDPVGVHVIIHGQVQMVGFRYFAWRTAERHAISGWVRNRRDGAVEVEAAGPRRRLDAFVQDLRSGPPTAVVTGIDIDWLDPPPEHHGFTIAHSP